MTTNDTPKKLPSQPATATISYRRPERHQPVRMKSGQEVSLTALAAQVTR